MLSLEMINGHILSVFIHLREELSGSQSLPGIFLDEKLRLLSNGFAIFFPQKEDEIIPVSFCVGAVEKLIYLWVCCHIKSRF